MSVTESGHVTSHNSIVKPVCLKALLVAIVCLGLLSLINDAVMLEHDAGAHDMSGMMMMMPMYFSTKWQGINVLFQWWKVVTPLGYLVSLLVVIALSALLGAIEHAQIAVDRRIVARRVRDTIMTDPSGAPLRSALAPEVVFTSREQLPRTVLEAIRVAHSFLVMLIVMTFDVGMFFAVVVGQAASYYVFSRSPNFIVKPKKGCSCS